MGVMKKSYEMDMCSGPLLSKILVFSIPLMLSGILQLLFNAADIIVVGRFTGSEALAAVGSTSALINLIINLFIGISVGANVAVLTVLSASHSPLVSSLKSFPDSVVLYNSLYFVIIPFTEVPDERGTYSNLLIVTF